MTLSTPQSDPTLLQALEDAVLQGVTPGDLYAQRISYVLSSLPRGSTVTRDEVEAALAAREGRRAER